MPFRPPTTMPSQQKSEFVPYAIPDFDVPLATHPLTRIDTSSSISTNATAPNLEGTGRTVGLLFDYLRNRLEARVNPRSTSSNNPQNVHAGVPLTLVKTASSIDSNATAPNLEGAGRTVGLVLDWVGGALESFMKKRAVATWLWTGVHCSRYSLPSSPS